MRKFIINGGFTLKGCKGNQYTKNQYNKAIGSFGHNLGIRILKYYLEVSLAIDSLFTKYDYDYLIF